MGEAVDDQGAIVRPHHLGLAAAVVDALQGVGQRLADELVGVGEHRGDRHDAEVVEVQLDVGEKDPRCRAFTCRCADGGVTSDLAEIFSASARSCRSRTSVAALLSLSALTALASLTRCCSVLGQLAQDQRRIDGLTIGHRRLALAGILFERRIDDRRRPRSTTARRSRPCSRPASARATARCGRSHASPGRGASSDRAEHAEIGRTSPPSLTST